MATITTLAPLPDFGGSFSANNLAAITAALAAQNTNNTNINAALAVLAALGLTGADAITAHAGGGQGSGFLLSSNLNRVATVGTIGDSVLLPVSAVGALCVVTNDVAAKAIQVFGSGTDTIDDVATATGVRIPAQSSGLFFCPVIGKWYGFYNNYKGLTALTTNGAIDPHAAAKYVITKAGVLADTLAAPTATVDDGQEIEIISSTANAHTLTATGLFGTGAAPTDLATFAAFAGAGLRIVAYQAKWLVKNSVGVVFT